MKRKKEYKNCHKHQLINPTKLFKMLEKLKRSGNKYYQFYEDLNQYQARYKELDPIGYAVLFNDDVEGDVEKMDDIAMEVHDEVLEEIDKDLVDSDGDDNEAEKDDIEYETKDPVKKYLFEYNKSLCMAHKYPEISVNEPDTVSVAPGEGKIPKT